MRRGARDHAKIALEINATIAFLDAVGAAVSRRAVEDLLRTVTGHSYRHDLVAQFVSAYFETGVVVVSGSDFGTASGPTNGGQNGGRGPFRDHTGTTSKHTGDHNGTIPQHSALASPPAAPVNTLPGPLGDHTGTTSKHAGDHTGTAPASLAFSANGVRDHSGTTSKHTGDHTGTKNGATTTPAHTRVPAALDLLAISVSSIQASSQDPSVDLGQASYGAPPVFFNKNPCVTAATEIAARTPDETTTARSLPVAFRGGPGSTRSEGVDDPGRSPTQAANPEAMRRAPVAPQPARAPRQPMLKLLGAPGTPATEHAWVTALREAVHGFIGIPLCHLDGEQRITFGRYHAWRFAACTKNESVNKRRGGQIAKAYGDMAHADQFMDCTVGEIIKLCRRYHNATGGAPWFDPWLIKAIDDHYEPKVKPPKPIPTYTAPIPTTGVLT
jgi:hypothetical protein